MNRALKFARLDFTTIKPYLSLKNMLIFLFIFAFIGYSSGNSSTMIGMMMMYATLYVSYPFAVGDKNGIDTLYCTLPISKKDVVIGRYVFSLLLNLIVGAIAFIASALLMTTRGGFNGQETFMVVLLCVALFTTVQAIQLPIYFKLGYAKAKLLAYLPFIAFPAIIVMISAYLGEKNMMRYLESIFSQIQANIFITALIAAVIWGLVMSVSGMLSYRFYRKREI